MCPDLPGNQNRPSRAPRAHSLPVQDRPKSGRAPFWAQRGAMWNSGGHSRLIEAFSTRRPRQSCTDPRSGPDRVGASGEGWMAGRAARSKAKGAPTR